jgi:hypothetical protein
MRRTKRSGNFFLCLLINMLLNLEWSIPAWILLGLHFWLDISIIWFVAALALWIINIIFWMRVMGWATECSNTPDPPKENKNPYSVKKSEGDKR